MRVHLQIKSRRSCVGLWLSSPGELPCGVHSLRKRRLGINQGAEVPLATCQSGEACGPRSKVGNAAETLPHEFYT